MELSDKVKGREFIPRGTVLTSKELEIRGFYDTGNRLDSLYVYHGDLGVCLLEKEAENLYKVYLNRRSER